MKLAIKFSFKLALVVFFYGLSKNNTQTVVIKVTCIIVGVMFTTAVCFFSQVEMVAKTTSTL